MNTSITKYGTWVLLVAFLSLLSCNKDDPETQARKDREKILKYIQDHDLDAMELESGLFYVIEEEGSGNYPSETSYVQVNYTGKLIDETIFDSGNQMTIYLPNTIEGWREGIPLFNRGGKGILLIPSGMGYGRTERSRIPANSVLIFNIELIEFSN